ncbi:MAG: branched-chain amino acid aminotransferase [Clostridia bacterium]
MEFIKASKLKEKPKNTNLKFGSVFTDYMLEMDYDQGKWSAPLICPYHDLTMSPATLCLHYGQGIFEGCKAFKNNQGEITLFRIDDNLARMNLSADRMCMPRLDVELVKQALIELIKLEKDWIPVADGCSLYIRPTMVATDVGVGVRPGLQYKFFVILSPVGAYLHGIDCPSTIRIEDHYVRAAIGGTGEAKCMGNYATSLLAVDKAKKDGYDEVLWLDAAEHKYIEEVGAMNVIFVVDGKVITPALNGSILRGITRDSVLKILRNEGIEVEERRISVEELITAHKAGKFTEMFGVGTAAVVSPVSVLAYKGVDYRINDGKVGEISKLAYYKLDDIRTRKTPDKFNWLTIVK